MLTYPVLASLLPLIDELTKLMRLCSFSSTSSIVVFRVVGPILDDTKQGEESMSIV